MKKFFAENYFKQQHPICAPPITPALSEDKQALHCRRRRGVLRQGVRGLLRGPRAPERGEDSLSCWQQSQWTQEKENQQIESDEYNVSSRDIYSFLNINGVCILKWTFTDGCSLPCKLPSLTEFFFKRK